MEGPQQEPTLEEQVSLAKTLSEAVDRRNFLTEHYPELDDLSVFVNASAENRNLYEGLEDAANRAREAFDKAVLNKNKLVEHLRKIGENKLADRIVMMFGVK
ncbi:MAG: hypothetical protein AAB861_04305 [Patescibacteria group bacterium]